MSWSAPSINSTPRSHDSSGTEAASHSADPSVTQASDARVGRFFSAALLGTVAAVAGAAIYYGIIALTRFEIGIVAILIGDMVGRAVRFAAPDGGREYQILAVALTYLSVAMAYAPLAFYDLFGHLTGTLLVPTLGRIVTLPVVAIMKSMPSGLISALIIGIGMRQAWAMTASHARVDPPDQLQTAPPDVEPPAQPMTSEMTKPPVHEAEHTAAESAAAPLPWYKRGIAAAVAVILLLFSKLKFLILGLTKASTFLSMFAFFGVYWTAYGWPLALGLVVSIYIHEMGHVAMLRRFGIQAGAPLFIPGVGALVLLRQRITDPRIDAQIGLAGPVWGLAAGVAAYAVYLATGASIWGAIAALTGFINLFNLIPVWQLDGSRGFHALASWQRWVVVAAMGIAGYVTGQRLMLLLGIVAVWRALQRTDAPGDRWALRTYVLLVFALSWLSVSHSIR